MNVVTGGFGYTGSYITHPLLMMGERVRTLTGRPHQSNPFRHRVEVASFVFDNRGELIRALAGASTLYNTYWVRFEYASVTFEQAVQNMLALFRAAKDAGVRRVVHLSITNPSLDSPLPYFPGRPSSNAR
ncbi:MAG: NAD-dependent epimerase/dehydratase family protein [Candidatus Rokubacteria bacterium]|nr:NAD-dependent epimerase/dehydratase family protein [Candidatus Rokubacteria bacterium]